MSPTTDLTRDLTLLLLSLTAFRERKTPLRRSWKGYPFEALDDLSEQGFISGSRAAKSVYLTEAGEVRARELLRAYGLEDRA